MRVDSSSRSPADRPAGATISRGWPVDAVVGENGAFMRHDDGARRLFRRSPTTAAPRRARLPRSASRSSRRCRARASDERYRESDLAIDYCEDVTRCRAGGRPDRLVDAGGGNDRESELDPRQRVVRRLRQAVDDANPFAEAFRPTSMPSANNSSSSATRRTTRRCSRTSRMRSALRTSVNSPIGLPHSRRTSRALRPGRLRRACGLPAGLMDETSPRPLGLLQVLFLSGKVRMRLPVAAKMALSTAGAATAIVGLTPPQNPPEGITIVSTAGISSIRSTR